MCQAGFENGAKDEALETRWRKARVLGDSRVRGFHVVSPAWQG